MTTPTSAVSAIVLPPWWDTAGSTQDFVVIHPEAEPSISLRQQGALRLLRSGQRGAGVKASQVKATERRRSANRRARKARQRQRRRSR